MAAAGEPRGVGKKKLFQRVRKAQRRYRRGSSCGARGITVVTLAAETREIYRRCFVSL